MSGPAGADRNGLTFRVDSLVESAKRGAWLDLLHDIFELDLAAFSRLGIWPEGYRAFSWMDGDAIAANVSTRPLPLVVDGRTVAAGQIHAVATRPAFRRRGLFNDLMRRALAHADGCFECLLLYTESPALYAPFGFRPLAQHRFRGRPAWHGSAGAAPTAARPLSLADAADIATIRELFAGRQPVSRRLGLVANEDIFFATALAHPDWRLDLLPANKALVVWERAEGVTRLHDIVARRLPDAADLAAALHLDGHAAEIEVLFPPDLLPGDFSSVPHVPEEDDMLLVRGPFAGEAAPFMLPLTAVS